MQWLHSEAEHILFSLPCTDSLNAFLYCKKMTSILTTTQLLLTHFLYLSSTRRDNQLEFHQHWFLWLKASGSLWEVVSGWVPGSDLDKMLQYAGWGEAAEGGEGLENFFIKALVLQQLSAPTCEKWTKIERKRVAVTIVTEDSRGSRDYRWTIRRCRYNKKRLWNIIFNQTALPDVWSIFVWNSLKLK